MISTVPATKPNAHIAALKCASTEAAKPIEWLVIAHNDARMLSSLSSALEGESAAILEVSQDAWDFEGGVLQETIEWALQQGELKNVLLVGNSQAAACKSRASLVAPESKNGARDSYENLLAGVRDNIARNQAAQENFTTDFQQMSQIPAVAERCENSSLAIYGLFYRAESGTFLIYDCDSDTFRALNA